MLYRNESKIQMCNGLIYQSSGLSDLVFSCAPPQNGTLFSHILIVYLKSSLNTAM